MSRFRFILLPAVLAVALSLTIRAIAQVPDPVVAASAPQPGSEHSYIGMGAETVNPADGQVSFDLPIHTPAGRGLSFPFGIRFNAGESWHLTIQNPNSGAFQWAFEGGNGADGWSYELPYLAGQELAAQVWTTATSVDGNVIYTQHQCDGASNFVFRGFDGQQYTLGLAGGAWNDAAYVSTNQGDCVSQSPYDFVSTSNNHGILATYPPAYTGWPLVPPITVVDQSGTSYYFSNLGGTYDAIGPNSPWGVGGLAQTITDKNGNQVVLNQFAQSGNSIIGSYNDTLGRTAVSFSYPLASNPLNYITVSGLSSSIVVHWSSGSVGGANYPMSGYMLTGTATCTVPTTGPAAGNEGITEIDYPNGQSYKFAYNSTYGTISQITFPDGGSVSYTWGLNASGGETTQAWWFNNDGYLAQEICTVVYAVPVITDRWVNDGTKNVLHQVFSYCESWVSSCPSAYKTTTVTSYDLVSGSTSVTTYTYGEGCPDQVPWAPSCPNFVPLDVQIAHQDGSGNTLQTQYKEWYYSHSVIASQTVLDNGRTTTELRCLDTNEQVANLYEYGFPSEGSYPGDPQPNNISCGSKSGVGATIGPLRRQTVNAYHNFMGGSPATHIVNEPNSVTVYDGSGNQLKQTSYAYDGSSVVASGAKTGLVSPPGLRGNATTVTRWLNTGSSPTTTYTYYDTGQVASMTDPCGNGSCADMTGSNHTISYSYADNYATGTPPGQTNAYLTQVTYPNTGIERFSWNYATGLLASTTDENSETTTYIYNDPLDRLTQTNYPDGGQTMIVYNDTPPSPTVTTCQNINGTANATCSATSPPTGWKTSLLTMDGVGHVVQTALVSDPGGTDYTVTVYDGNYRVYTVTNPYRSTSDPTYGTTTYTYDALGRTTTVAEPDGSAVTTVYDQTNANSTGTCTTVTDEAGKSRQSCVDGLGRMTGVWENPAGLNYETDYTYDPLNNLTNVNQKGSTGGSPRARTFTYDSLSRLVCAANPEVQPVTCPSSATGTFPTGAITYTYDANGNAATKTAPSPNQGSTGTAQVTTTYTYDALNRLTSKSYKDAYAQNPTTPAVSYAYDGNAANCPSYGGFEGVTNSIGRRTGMCFAAGSKSWKYDPMGRIAAEGDGFVGLVPPYNSNVVVTLNGVPTISTNTLYYYYLNGDFYEDDAPDWYYYATVEGGAGEITAVSDPLNNVLTLATYTPTRQLAHAWVSGDGTSGAMQITNSYNSRLQPVNMSVVSSTNAAILNLTYNFNLGNGDNGNVIQIANGKDSNRTQNFLYDPLNRIWQAYTNGNSPLATSWGETYSPNTYAAGTTFSSSYAGIDAWGNLTNRSGVTGKTYTEGELNCPANARNQLNTCYTYDAAGNLIANGSTTYTYDAENRLIATSGESYLYDGDGNRVEKCTAGTTPGTCASSTTGRFYWLHQSGSTLSESDLGGNFTAAYDLIHGQIAARIDLPSETVHYYFHDHLGSTSIVTDGSGDIENESDYYPYGGELVITQTDTNRYKFTGKERDSESGLDNFEARYYASPFGRFMTPDWAARPTAVPYAVFGDPQSLNLYAYVRNDPVTVADADGHTPYGEGAGPLETCPNDLNCFADKVDLKDEKQAQQDESAKATLTAQNNNNSQTQNTDKKEDIKPGDHVFVKVGSGLGLGVHAKVGPVKVEAEVSVKSEGEYTPSGKAHNTVVEQAAVSGQAVVGIQAGYKSEDIRDYDMQQSMTTPSAPPEHVDHPFVEFLGPGGSHATSESFTIEVGGCLVVCFEIGIGVK